jgi:prepilin-type N-terminal cleavage/methylation domain-containing protein
MNQKGFTLVELMVALMIVAVGMLAMANMLIVGVRANQMSEHRIDAAGIAHSVLASISARAVTAGYTSAQARADAIAQLGKKSLFHPSLGDPNFPDFRISPDPTKTGPVDIVVSLNWMEHGVQKNITLRTRVVVP